VCPFDDLDSIKNREAHPFSSEFGLEVLFISVGGVDAAQQKVETQIVQVPEFIAIIAIMFI
jgi:hypothetical protein